MFIDAMDMIREHIEHPESRAEFGAEGVKLALAFALLEARESAGMTRAELAEASGVSEAYISKLESGDANPAVGKVGEIFAAMWMKPAVGFAPLTAEGEKASANGAGAMATPRAPADGRQPAPTLAERPSG